MMHSSYPQTRGFSSMNYSMSWVKTRNTVYCRIKKASSTFWLRTIAQLLDSEGNAPKLRKLRYNNVVNQSQFPETFT